MNKSIKTGILFLLLLHTSYVSPIIAQDNYQLRKLKFTGNESFSSGTLLDQVSLYGTSKFSKLILRRKPFLYSRDILESDLKNLKRFYQREGFLNAKVTIGAVEVNDEKEMVSLIIDISEGKPILVSAVDYSLSMFSESVYDELAAFIDRVLESLNLERGVRFSDKAVSLDQEILTDLLMNSGYPYARVNPLLEVDTIANQVSLNWSIESGPRCIFGGATITGSGYVSSSLVSRQLAFREGEVYDQRLLNKSQEQVYGLGVFQIVTVKSQLSKDEEESVPVIIQLKEAPRFGTRFGIGYGREDKFRVFSEFRYFDFLGGARRLNLFLKHSGLEPYNIDLKLTQPALITPRTTLVANPYILRQEEPGYTVNRVGGSSTIMHQIIRNLSVSATYSFEQTRLDTNSIATDEGFGILIPEVYKKSSIILGSSWDNSNPMFSPTKGMFSTLVFKLSGLGFSSDYHYSKLLFEGRKYLSLWRTVLALKGKVGGIGSRDEHGIIPVEDRLYSGGSNSVRGWLRSMLGPLDEDNVPRGGNSLFEGSLELRYPIIGLLSGVAFMDFGNVWLDSYTYKIEDLHYSAGLGLRFNTPIGPIRFDTASPVWDKEKRVQFHISVGQAF
ncbi:outer membrane protein assembly factor BamA [bacterium]|nr:outer membrane protein assembly factor BamA [bacterium]